MKNTKSFFLISIFTLFLLSCDYRLPNNSSASIGVANSLSNLVDTEVENRGFMDCENPCLEKVELEFDDYSGSFLIEENSHFQSVYSSQNYDTFYQIFCKANFYENTDDNEEYLESFEFRIINFKGPLNLGFSQNNNQKSELQYEPEEDIIGLKVILKGASPLNALKFDVKDKNIKKGEVNTLNIYRILIPMFDEEKSITKDGIFDSEFYTRSGIGTKQKKKRVPGLDGYSKDSLGGFKMKYLLSKNPLKMTGDSKNCYSSSIVVEW